MTERRERRGAMRVAILAGARARVPAPLEVWLVDLSASGARITLGELLEHGASCVLELPPALGSLTLSARVMWSGLFGGEQTPEGERNLIYQSGLTFTDLPKDQQTALAAIVERFTRRRGPGRDHGR
jgi:hypothetical protein